MVFLFLALVAILFNGAERFVSNFGRQSPEEHSCEIISKSVHRFSRGHFKLFSIYSPGSQLVQRRGTV